MSAREVLWAGFERVQQQGFTNASATDRELFLIQEFLFGYENGGLSGYFYNRLPDLVEIEETVVAMQRRRLSDLAGFLQEAVGLFAHYMDPTTPMTWGEVQQKYDPTGRLDEIHRMIAELDDYGLSSAALP